MERSGSISPVQRNLRGQIINHTDIALSVFGALLRMHPQVLFACTHSILTRMGHMHTIPPNDPAPTSDTKRTPHAPLPLPRSRPSAGSANPTRLPFIGIKGPIRHCLYILKSLQVLRTPQGNHDNLLPVFMARNLCQTIARLR